MIGYIAMKNTYTTGVMCCLLATLSWGATFPIMTSALTRCDPYTFTTLRYGFAGLALVVALGLREGRQGLSLKGQRVGLAWLLARRDLSVLAFGLLRAADGRERRGVDGLYHDGHDADARDSR
jgi:drug/metabolite transporter (DMT)-like permease